MEAMTEVERTMLLRLAWYPPDAELLGERARPLSLGTWQAMRLMGLRLLDRETVLEPADEYRELMAYLWLHREPVETVASGLWSGTWRAMLEVAMPEEPPVELLSRWREARERLMSLLEATEITIRPKPKGGEDRTPFEVRGPDETAHLLSVVGRATGLGCGHLLWEMPVYQLRQIYHAEMRWNGFWTVRPAREVPAEAFEGFEDGVLGNLFGEVE